MRLKTIALWPILIFFPIVYAHAQETQHVEADQKLRARASLYEPLIASAAQRYNVDPRLLWTIAYLESRFRQGAISYKDGQPCAYGMMQFTVPTAARYGLKNPHDAKEAIDAAARYVRDLQTRFGARGDLILAAYNAGEGTVEAFRAGKRLILPNMKIINPGGIQTGGIPPYQETRDYVERGKMIYRQIDSVGLFQGTAKTRRERYANEGTETEADSEGAIREESLYVLESSTPRITPTPVKSVKRRSFAQVARSVYVN
jgi:soluble lytic murein transglycosylase-like protein